jgi:2-dehydropantoate 2-reductase
MSASEQQLAHIAVLGAGAMGSFVGGSLVVPGRRVTLLDVNVAHVAAIVSDGLHVSTDAGERVVRPSAMRPDELDAVPDLLIVLTKQPYTVAALEMVVPRIGESTWVLTLQNGLGNQELIERFIPRERILIGITTYPADLQGPGRVASHGEGQLRLMTADGVRRPVADAIAAAFAAVGQDCVVDPDLAAAVWAKVAFNCALNSICGVTGCMVGQVGKNPAGRQLAIEVAAEVVAVANKAGIATDGAKVRMTLEHAMDTHLTHKPSLLQDMLAGRATEIGSINGAVVAIAERVGCPVPRTAALLALVRLAEQQRAEQHSNQAA